MTCFLWYVTVAIPDHFFIVQNSERKRTKSLNKSVVYIVIKLGRWNEFKGHISDRHFTIIQVKSTRCDVSRYRVSRKSQYANYNQNKPCIFRNFDTEAQAKEYMFTGNLTIR